MLKKKVEKFYRINVSISLNFQDFFLNNYDLHRK